jgi:dGTPase
LALLLPEEVRWHIAQEPENVYGTLRQVIDFVSGLTDRHAISLYKKINGFSY